MLPTKIKIRSYATVTGVDGNSIKLHKTLRSFHRLKYSTHELGNELKDDARISSSLSEKLIKSGPIELEFDDTENVLFVVTEYLFSEELSNLEIQQLITYTSGHWTDGIGASFSEEFFHDKGYRCELVGDHVFFDMHALLVETNRRVLQEFN